MAREPESAEIPAEPRSLARSHRGSWTIGWYWFGTPWPVIVTVTCILIVLAVVDGGPVMRFAAIPAAILVLLWSIARLFASWRRLPARLAQLIAFVLLVNGSMALGFTLHRASVLYCLDDYQMIADRLLARLDESHSPGRVADENAHPTLAYAAAVRRSDGSSYVMLQRRAFVGKAPRRYIDYYPEHAVPSVGGCYSLIRGDWYSVTCSWPPIAPKNRSVVDNDSTP